ncbi:TIGR03089 family protein [Amycolatopsis suaedae]|uniref:TIGR03089 family protein n=1 Tax=Amycolatopsis suaedae TaxID=2510978 RepID=A0A4Q7J6F2_9PSEU|nr:TIGR03089 family protein [Amycolatopsis suaedae]RZQ62717.1 TIGR03089 family protein [Amycolatopsis suaedae]
MSLTEQLLRPLLARSAAKPLITHYDDAAGTRVELSVATLANWAAKTANWLVDEADVEPGDPVSVALPAHWQTAGVLLGAWWCGATVVESGGRVAFVDPSGEASAEITAVVSLDPMGRGLSADPGEGRVDFLSDARLAGDDFVALSPVPGSTPALGSSTVDETLERARAAAVPPGARVLSTLEWTVPDGVLAGFLAPLAAGASLVQVSNADPAKLADKENTERTVLRL